MGVIISVTSGKGGTGKTTTTAAISSCFAVLGHKTLCIDFDGELRNLDISLAMTNYTIIDFMDVVTGKRSLMDACSESPDIKGLYFLTAPINGVPENVSLEDISKMFDEIRNEFDFCLIDSPPGIGREFKLANNSVDISIIVTTCETPALRDATRVADALRNSDVKQIRLIVNKVEPKKFRQIKRTIDDIIDITGVRLLAIVPEDRYIFSAIHQGIPLVLYKKRKSVYAFLDASRRLAGEEIPLKYN